MDNKVTVAEAREKMLKANEATAAAYDRWDRATSGSAGLWLELENARDASSDALQAWTEARRAARQRAGKNP